MTNGCPPPPIPAPNPGVVDPCAVLPHLRQALYELMAGKTRSKLRYRERETEYHQGNVKELRAEVRRLELICGPCQQRAVQAGPHRHPFGFGRDPYGRF